MAQGELEVLNVHDAIAGGLGAVGSASEHGRSSAAVSAYLFSALLSRRVVLYQYHWESLHMATIVSVQIAAGCANLSSSSSSSFS